MSRTARRTMTVEEFFDWQQRQDRNYELVDGIPVLPVKSMTGASRRHDRITINAIVSLGSQLRGKPCRASSQDQSVRTFRGTRRPDLTVDCGTADDRSMAVAEPRLVMEVLSPSTLRYDRFQKLAEYQRLDATRVILMVDTEFPRVTLWRRVDGMWTTDVVEGLDATIPLPEIEASLPLADLYADIAFGEPD